MPNNGQDLHERFTEELWKLYYEMAKLSVVFYPTNNKEHVYKGTHLPKFCNKIYDLIISKKIKCCKNCKIIEIKKNHEYEGLFQCDAGLWCYAQPVKVDKEVIGTFVVGHRRIEGRENESKTVLENMLKECNVDVENSKILMELLEKVPAVEDNFNSGLLERFSVLEKYVIIEHQRADTFKGEAVRLAHAVLMPIQSIVADAENLFTESPDNSELKEIAEDILQETIKLSFIAENMLGNPLEEPDEYEYKFYDMDIYPIIEDTVDLFRKQAKKKDIIIDDPVETNVPTSYVEMVKPHIKQVFFNLMHNAVKYSYTSTKKSRRYITVNCTSHKNFYCVEISNYGIGIMPDELTKIFEPGYRGKLTHDRQRTGSGFGLPTAKRFVEKIHHGKIEIESEQAGLGQEIDPYRTTVRVCIPFTQPRRK